MPKIPKKILLMLVVFIVSLGIRLMYKNYNGSVSIYSDTYSYYLTGEKILDEPFKYIINTQRPFLYPLFLHLSMIITGFTKPAILSNEFFQGLQTVYLLQMYAAVFSIVVLFVALVRLSFTPIVSMFFSVFIACNILLFSWERVPLTESLSISFLILLLFVLVETLKKPLFLRLLVTLFVCCSLFLLRPIYIALPFFVFPFVAIFHKKKKILINIGLTLFLFVLFLFYYHLHNALVFGLVGITETSDTNLLGKILKFELPIEEGKKYTFLYQNITEYRKQGGVKDPFRFLEYYERSKTSDPEGKFHNLKPFSTAIIKAHIGEYLFKSMSLIPDGLIDSSEMTNLPNHPHPYAPFFSVLYVLYKKIQFIGYFLLPAYLINLYFFFKRRNFEVTLMLIVGTISWYQIFFSVLFAYAEFGRLIAPVQPLLYLFIFYWFSIVVKQFFPVAKKQLKFHSKKSAS